MRAAISLVTFTCLFAGPASSSQDGRKGGKDWPVGRTYELKGTRVTLSAPVLVARSKGFLWFPTLIRFDNGDLLAVMSDQPDEHHTTWTAQITWSLDGGLTWTEPKGAPYTENPVRRANGDFLMLPFALFPRPGGMGAPYTLVRKGSRDVQVVKEGVTVTGWPRPDEPPEKTGRSGFVFNGQTVELRKGGYLATLHGLFKGSKRYSLVAAESADGVKWKVRSVIADENCKVEGSEGPCEAAMCRLKDGRLMCVFRVGINVPYGQAWSSDEGRTWSEAVAIKGAFSVQPSLAVLKDGRVVLGGGRAGLLAWFDVDGVGLGWEALDVGAHHNGFQPKDAIARVDATFAGADQTSSYTEVVALDEKHLLYLYDRIPHGWAAVPKDSEETNSVWVIRVRLGD